MAPTRRQFLGATTAAAVGLSGCSGDGSTGNGSTTQTSTPTPSSTPTEPPTTEAPMDRATVAVRAHADHGEILVDGGDRTLYMFDADARDAAESSCHEDCAEAWPPLTTEAPPDAGDRVEAGLDTFDRSGGATQVVAGGWPLYYFRNDDGPGDANGQGLNDAWWVLAPDGTPKRPPQATVQVARHPDHGEILVDGEGRTLYMFDRDTRGEGASTCSDGCAEAWPPLTTARSPAAGDDVEAGLTTFERADGSLQVAAAGWPLYYFQNDAEPGDANGQGVNDAWWVLGPDGTPKRPEVATVQVRTHPDHGDILVNGQGLTLYAFDADETAPPASACTGGCADAWPPLVSEGAPDVGDAVEAAVATFDRADGTPQVTAGGWPLYGYAADSEPGDASGQGVNDAWWVVSAAGTPQRPGDGSNDGGDSNGGGGGTY